MTDLDTLIVRFLPCPHCRAVKGGSCATPSGYIRSPHPKRQDLALLVQEMNRQADYLEYMRAMRASLKMRQAAREITTLEDGS
jgi:hypothetical protein